MTHYAACHSERELLGGHKVESGKFAGSDMLPGGGKAPAIHPDTFEARGCDAGSLACALKTGITPSGDAFGNAMGEVVTHGTLFLSAEDLDATAGYLMNLQE